jgi:hypothetical protein
MYISISKFQYHFHTAIFIVKPVLRGHLWDKETVALYERLPLKRGLIHMKCSMTGQEKDDPLIQVTV